MASGGSSDAPRRGNGIGTKIFPAYTHCVSINGKARNVKCKYCEKELTGGIDRVKFQLMGKQEI